MLEEARGLLSNVRTALIGFVMGIGLLVFPFVVGASLAHGTAWSGLLIPLLFGLEALAVVGLPRWAVRARRRRFGPQLPIASSEWLSLTVGAMVLAVTVPTFTWLSWYSFHRQDGTGVGWLFLAIPAVIVARTYSDLNGFARSPPPAPDPS